jgi:hypothetical protein
MLKKVLPVMGLLAAAGAQAQGTGAVDVSAVTPVITAQSTPIAAIGVAVLGILVVIAAYKWVRRAF